MAAVRLLALAGLREMGARYGSGKCQIDRHCCDGSVRVEAPVVTPALFASGAARTARHRSVGRTARAALHRGDRRRRDRRLFARTRLYPPHPLDDMLTGPSAGTSPYFGALGVFWGIAYLSAAGVIDDRRDWVRPRLDAMIDANAGSSFAEGSLLMGPLPALALRARLQPYTSATVDRDVIHAALARAADGSVQELMWGIPGGAMLAEQLLRETGEPRWKALLRKQLDAIWRARVDVPGIGLLWNEELYGSRNLYLGAVHGFGGPGHAAAARLYTVVGGSPVRGGQRHRADARRDRGARRNARELADIGGGGRSGVPGSVLPRRAGRDRVRCGRIAGRAAWRGRRCCLAAAN